MTSCFVVAVTPAAHSLPADTPEIVPDAVRLGRLGWGIEGYRRARSSSPAYATGGFLLTAEHSKRRRDAGPAAVPLTRGDLDESRRSKPRDASSRSLEHRGIRGRTQRRFLSICRPIVGLDTLNSPVCRGKYHRMRMSGCCLPLFVEGCPDSRRWRRRP